MINQSSAIDCRAFLTCSSFHLYRRRRRHHHHTSICSAAAAKATEINVLRARSDVCISSFLIMNHLCWYTGLIHSNAHYYLQERISYIHYIQEAQLSQRGRAMLRVIEYFSKPLKVTQGHWICHYSIHWIQVPIAFHIVTMALFCIISDIKRDSGRKSRFFHTSPAFDTSVRRVTVWVLP